MKFNIARKYRIYPNKEQQSIIINTCDCCRFIWNKLLEKAKDSYFDPEETFNIVKYSYIVHEYPFSHCHFKVDELKLSQRIFTCPKCGNVMDRDINAAINLRNEALDTLNKYRCDEYKFTLSL